MSRVCAVDEGMLKVARTYAENHNLEFAWGRCECVSYAYAQAALAAGKVDVRQVVGYWRSIGSQEWEEHVWVRFGGADYDPTAALADAAENAGPSAKEYQELCTEQPQDPDALSLLSKHGLLDPMKPTFSLG